MELLKKTLRVASLLIAINLYGQPATTVQDAFSQSYTAEYNGNYTNAINALLPFQKDSYEVNLRLGWLYYYSKNYQSSISSYQSASAIMPASVEALLGLVNPYAVLAKWDDIEKVYSNILKIDPKNSLINYRMGLINFNKKEYVKAEKYFSVTLNLYPFDYDNVLMSAWTYYYIGKFKDAQTLFKRVLLIKPKDSSASQGLALIK